MVKEFTLVNLTKIDLLNINKEVKGTKGEKINKSFGEIYNKEKYLSGKKGSTDELSNKKSNTMEDKKGSLLNGKDEPVKNNFFNKSEKNFEVTDIEKVENEQETDNEKVEEDSELKLIDNSLLEIRSTLELKKINDDRELKGSKEELENTVKSFNVKSEKNNDEKVNVIFEENDFRRLNKDKIGFNENDLNKLTDKPNDLTDEKISSKGKTEKSEIGTDEEKNIRKIDKKDIKETDEKELRKTDKKDIKETDEKELRKTDKKDIKETDEKELRKTDKKDIKKTDEKELRKTDKKDIKETDEKELRKTDKKDIKETDEKELRKTDKKDIKETDEKELRKTDKKDIKETDEKELKKIDKKDIKETDEKELRKTDKKDIKETDEKELKKIDKKDIKETDEKELKKIDKKDIKETDEKELKKIDKKDVKEADEKELKKIDKKDIKEIDEKGLKEADEKKLENIVEKEPKIYTKDLGKNNFKVANSDDKKYIEDTLKDLEDTIKHKILDLTDEKLDADTTKKKLESVFFEIKKTEDLLKYGFMLTDDKVKILNDFLETTEEKISNINELNFEVDKYLRKIKDKIVKILKLPEEFDLQFDKIQLEDNMKKFSLQEVNYESDKPKDKQLHENFMEFTDKEKTEDVNGNLDNNINIKQNEIRRNFNQIYQKQVSRSTVDKSDLLNQITEKSKVVVTDDKSEIIISLKPESLGKLTLKIATENGVIMAKFAAESQQVKEVIETNMQILKDSLEKQGLSVEGFSVSVGDDTRRESNNNRFRRRQIKKILTNSYSTEDTDVISNNFVKANPYDVNQSQINFTA